MPVHELVPAARADEITEVVTEFIRGYRRTLQSDRRILLEQFRFVDLARKVVGVGSVGTRAWIALLMGLDGQDPLFIQVKEAQPSVLEEFAGKSRLASAGERVVHRPAPDAGVQRHLSGLAADAEARLTASSGTSTSAS